MKEELGKDFIVYSGCDEMAISGLIAGADGIIGSFYNCIPDMFLEINEAVKKNDLATAREKMRQADCVIHYCCKTPCYFTAIREITEIMGLERSYGRRPFEPFDEVQRKEFREGLKKLVEEKGIEAEFVKSL
jgi:N-acetylneuraminate lyase